MGLFDDLKKLTNDISKEIEKSGVKDDLAKFGKNISEGMQDLEKNAQEFIKNAQNSSEDGTNPFRKENNTKEIPAEYSEFPTFDKAPNNLKTIETEKYKRCSMDFYDYTEQEVENYKAKIIELGYVQNTKVRFDKGNTYIIVDQDDISGLNIVFHIKR